MIDEQSTPAPAPATSTKERILDAAESLFAERGIGETSLRSIISRASVNLAAVHYHFGSKEVLLRAVAHRRFDPVNQERLATLRGLEREAGGEPIELGKLVEAFFGPMVRFVDSHEKGPVFARFVGRLLVEPDYFYGKIAPTQFEQVRTEFLAAFRRRLPDLTADEIVWRLLFGIGAVAQTLRMVEHIPALSGGVCAKPEKGEALRRLVDFVTAAMRAPQTEVSR